MAGDNRPTAAPGKEQPGSAKPPRGRGLYILSFLLVAVVAGVVWHLVHRQENHVKSEAKEQTAEVEAGPRVRVHTIAPVAADREVDLLGETYPWQSTVLYAKVSGYLKDIKVDKGDRVEANEVLAVIESPETDQQYYAAVADAKNKRLNAERAKTLVKRDMISQQDADTAEADAEVAEANVSSTATLKSYEIMRAPFAGIVTARFADPGALVQNAANAQTSALPVVTVAQVDVLRTYVYPDQSAASFLRTGDEAEISLPERPNVRVNASVTRMSGNLDARTRTMLTEIDFHNRNNEILPGSFVHVALKISTRASKVLEAPASALVMQGEATYMAVVDATNHVQYRPVKIGSDDGTVVQVVSGVKAGDRVALDLGFSVNNGAAVQPIAEK